MTNNIDTPDTTWTVWIHPDHGEDRKPLEINGVVDVLKLPTGEVKCSQADGIVRSRYGEVIRLTQEDL